jgi:hypothetical protein
MWLALNIAYDTNLRELGQRIYLLTSGAAFTSMLAMNLYMVISQADPQSYILAIVLLIW